MGYTRLKHTKHKKHLLKLRFFHTLGNILLIVSILIIIKTFYQPFVYEVKFYLDNNFNKKTYVVGESKKVNFIDVFDKVKKIEILTPQDPYFSIIIPKIDANSKIIPNIDPSSPSTYLPALQKGVAHAKGTAFPGEGGHIFLFAHSTDYFWNITSYNAVFYLLYKLDFNDEIDLFYQNKRIVYRVIEKKVVDPSEVEYLTRKTDGEFLTLQTCWPLGTTLKRLMIFAERVVVE